MFTVIPETGRSLALVIRHGRTALNKQGLLRAWADVPLDRTGELDAQMAANALRPYDPKILYSSDLVRDMQTVNIISTAFDNLTTEVDYGLRTADMGEWTEQPEEDVAPGVTDWYRFPWTMAPSGESYDSFAARLYQFVDKKLELARDVPQMCPVGMCSHGRIFAALDSRYNKRLPIDGRMALPGGVGVIKQMPDGMLRFDFLGKTEDVVSDR